MARKLLERNSLFPYHVSNRSIDKAFYPIDLNLMWEETQDLLRILSWAYNAKIHAFVLMSNHFHLLVSTPSENLDDCMRYFQSNLSHWIRNQTTKDTYAFNTRYRWSIIKDPIYYANVYRYVYQNPIRAGIVKLAECYKFSTLSGKSGMSRLDCPLAVHEFDGCIPEIDQTELEWINQFVSKEDNRKTCLGLRRKIFSIPKRLRLKKAA